MNDDNDMQRVRAQAEHDRFITTIAARTAIIAIIDIIEEVCSEALEVATFEQARAIRTAFDRLLARVRG